MLGSYRFSSSRKPFYGWVLRYCMFPCKWVLVWHFETGTINCGMAQNTYTPASERDGSCWRVYVFSLFPPSPLPNNGDEIVVSITRTIAQVTPASKITRRQSRCLTYLGLYLCSRLLSVHSLVARSWIASAHLIAPSLPDFSRTQITWH
ncbi:hypothetical protein PILCRDRAFT_814982 [Piloderma croceum F 1598]|uniref:Uncharacterized protein n=1 Tax=Piloderma croceum (strain F 1598) TaxID=765440 RepID=A0A0C3GA08_PILCF|nr:hypothetical protein PILCRDRAFT_814982 [Piloderma croceum F 1598]